MNRELMEKIFEAAETRLRIFEAINFAGPKMLREYSRAVAGRSNREKKMERRPP